MKKIFVSMIFAFCAIAANAQFYVGGTVGFSSIEENNVTISNFTLAPEVGYKIDENWDLGLELGFSTAKETGEDSNNMFTLAPYARYTFAKLSNVDFFVQGQLEYINYGEDCGSGFGFAIEPGVSFNVNDKISLIGKIGALEYFKNDKDAGDGSIFRFGVDNTKLSVGVVYNF